MNMPHSSFQVQSINNFTCQHFQQLFDDGNKSGLITTLNNGRTYRAMWDTSTDTLSVKRDLTNVDGWTRISEAVQRWLQFDFTSCAAKWERRLTIQNCNVGLAEPLKAPINGLLQKINSTDTSIKLGSLQNKTIRDQLTQISSPLKEMLEEKKQILFAQAEQLSIAVNDEVTSDKLWVQQQNIKNEINSLKEQVSQLEAFIRGINHTIRDYCTAVAHIDVLTNSHIYSAVITRLSYVAIKMRLMLDNYFSSAGKVPEAAVNQYNSMKNNEKKIAAVLKSQPLDTHFWYNDLLSSPSYKNASCGNVQRQGKIKFNYSKYTFLFTNILIDTTKTFADIQNAADELELVRDRWLEQICLEEEFGELLTKCQNKQESCPVYVARRDQLQGLKNKLFNNGELLDTVKFELIKSEYNNIKRAKALYFESNQFLEELPGFVDVLTSNYNEEMQSRVLHLKELSDMCQNEPLTDQALDQMEESVTVNKYAIQTWANSDDFSRVKFYDPIQPGLTYPRWLMKENAQFKQKTQEILQTLWETKQVSQHNDELLRTREQLLENLENHSERLLNASEEFKEKAINFRRSFTIIGMISDFFGINSEKVKTEEINKEESKELARLIRRVKKKSNQPTSLTQCNPGN